MNISERVSSFSHWYHRIPLPDGSITPGISDSGASLALYDRLGLPARMEGMRVLDIGCSDGFFSFTAEARGASEVIGLDFRLPTATGFSVASEILGSRVRYEVDNLFNLTPERFGAFDLIIFVGVLYHLRNPLLALDRVRSVAREGALVLVESHVIDAELTETMVAAGSSAEVVKATASLPLWRFYLRDALNRDSSNRWAPTLSGLAQICEQAMLKPQAIQGYGSRGAVLCKAAGDPDLLEQLALDTCIGLNAP